MKRLIFILGLFSILLTACGGNDSPAATAVESYLQALSARDEARMLSYVCPDYEVDALLEYDAFALVQTTLEGLACEEIGVIGEDVVVVCAGSIEATYGSELRSFDLSERGYRVVNDGGNWLVCGYEYVK
ncbi:MAG: hypothetical protein AB1846_16825 [Chloroflexota bacterium]